MTPAQNDRALLGRFGERAAARYLVRHGYTVSAQNKKVGHKEIDLIVSKGDVLVFCEVKTRIAVYGQDSPYGAPRDAVNEKKQAHLRYAAERYLRFYPTDRQIRFDVIEVYASERQGLFGKTHYRADRIEHYENAF